MKLAGRWNGKENVEGPSTATASEYLRCEIYFACILESTVLLDGPVMQTW